LTVGEQSLPPWIDRPPLHQTYPVPLAISADALAAAADQWAGENRVYPRRDLA
jgi:hypothetical protein